MSLLYPRLLSAQAKELHREYQTLSIDGLRSRVAFQHESAVFAATGGNRARQPDLERVRAIVMELAERAGYPDESTQVRRGAFDLDVAAVLHREAGMVPAEAAAGDIWAFLALVVMPDVAYWRYPEPPGDRVLATDLTRHVFGRLWWRAQLVHEPGEPEPYAALGILGEAAFDQIYARRKALGGSPYLVKGILKVWKDLDRNGLGERDLLRDFLKRLLRLAPFMAFDALDERQLNAELWRTARDSVRALTG